ncbi:MAG TPA: carboxypeptidase-like regulatory domain-containing protein [Flavobacterium sp.]|jgi:hypothetical protein
MYISGKVLDKDKRAIPGANIDEFGTPFGATADENGHFDMYVASPENMLVFKHLSYESKMVKAKDFNSYVQLADGSTTLDEVIISGNAKKDNTLLYVLLAVAGTVIVAKATQKPAVQPRTVKP